MHNLSISRIVCTIYPPKAFQPMLNSISTFLQSPVDSFSWTRWLGSLWVPWQLQYESDMQLRLHQQTNSKPKLPDSINEQQRHNSSFGWVIESTFLPNQTTPLPSAIPCQLRLDQRTTYTDHTWIKTLTQALASSMTSTVQNICGLRS